MSNQQIHKRLTAEQVIAILENYLAKEIKAKEAMNNLGLNELPCSIIPEADQHQAENPKQIY